jgi:hypothetical protein
MNQETSNRGWMKHSSHPIPDKMDPATASRWAQPFARLLAGRRPEKESGDIEIAFLWQLKLFPDAN